MDTRRLLTTVVIVGALMIAYPYISKLWTNPKPVAPIMPTTASTGIPAGLPYPTIAPHPLGSEDGAVPTQIQLGNPNQGSDKVSITVDNVTADIDKVELNVKDYTQDARSKTHPAKPLTLMSFYPGQPRPYATLNVRYTFPDGSTGEGDFIGSQYVWKVEPHPANPYEARLLATLDYKGVPTLQITKVFRVDPNSYEVYISHEIKNLTNKPLKVQVNQMAALDMPLDTAQLDDRFYHAAGLNTGKLIIDADRYNMSHTELKKWTDNTKDVGSFLGKDPLEWIASSGRFFVAITRPLPESNSPPAVSLYGDHKIPVVNHIANANIDRLFDDSADVGKSITGIRLTGNDVDVPAGATESLPLSVYFGPKRQDILQGNYTAPVGSLPYDYAVFQYVKVIQLTSSSCFGIYKFCFVETLAYYMLWALDILKASVAFGNYGVAIILLVIFIKAAMHPLTKRAQVNMAVMGKKMKDIQPLIEANKKKYATDKGKQNEEMMRIYRENKVNPAGGIMGCLPMMLQTPIWIAVWEGLRSDISLRHAIFIPGWINDLSAPDATIIFAHPVHIPLISSLMGPIPSLNILPLLLAVVMFFQMKVQSASQPRSADPSQAQMQKMSQYMVLVFPLFLYNMPSGINLYYFASTLGGLVDTYFVRKSLKKKGILPTNARALPTKEEAAAT